MNPIIILGMDNTGKTTLVTGFEKELRGYLDMVGKILPSAKESTIEVIKSPGPLGRKDMHSWCYDQILKFGVPHKGYKVYDRFGCIDEQVYAPIVRNNPNIDHVEHLTDLMLRAPKEHRPFIVYARPPKSKILGFEDGREQMEGVVENGESLLAAYDEIFFRLSGKGFATLIYDYTEDSILGVLGDYVRYVAEMKLNTETMDKEVLINALNDLELFTEEEIEHADLETLRKIQIALKGWVSIFHDLMRNLELNDIRLAKAQEDDLLKKKLKAARQLITVNNRMFNIL